MTIEDDGKEAAERAKTVTIAAAEKRRVTLDRIMMRLNQGLNAKETKAFKAVHGTEEEGLHDAIIYSKPMVAHGIRLKAVDIALAKLHDLADPRPPRATL